MKKIGLIAILFIVFCGTVCANATESGYVSGAKWELDDAGNLTLTPSGSGNIPDYSMTSHAPWYNSRKNIKTITIGQGIKSIGQLAFYGCSNVEKVTLPTSGLKKIGRNVFSNFKITEISLPRDLTELSDAAFGNCTLLREVSIPASVSVVGNYVFDGCTALKSVTVNNKTVGVGMFEDCTALETADIQTVTSINPDAFSGCKKLKNIMWPTNSVSYLGTGAFKNCRALESIEIPLGVTSLPDYVFCYCTSIKKVQLPSRITKIGNGAFSYCSALSEVIMTENIKSIGYNAFSNCSALTEIILPPNITLIEHDTFYNCTSLKEVVIPSKVTEIGTMAFDGCGAMTRVGIGENVTKINKNAFRGTSVSDVYYALDDKAWAIYVGIKDGNDVINNAAKHYWSVSEVRYYPTEGIGAPMQHWRMDGVPFKISSVIPTRYGYDFMHWSTEEVIAGDTFYPGGLCSKPSGHVSLYAVWKPKTHKIYFNANGGTCSVSSKQVTYGQTYGEMPVPTNGNLKFAGWFTSNGKVRDAKYVTNEVENVTLYARWGELPLPVINANVTIETGMCMVDVNFTDFVQEEITAIAVGYLDKKMVAKDCVTLAPTSYEFLLPDWIDEVKVFAWTSLLEAKPLAIPCTVTAEQFQ